MAGTGSRYYNVWVSDGDSDIEGRKVIDFKKKKILDDVIALSYDQKNDIVYIEKEKQRYLKNGIEGGFQEGLIKIPQEVEGYAGKKIDFKDTGVTEVYGRRSVRDNTKNFLTKEGELIFDAFQKDVKVYENLGDKFYAGYRKEGDVISILNEEREEILKAKKGIFGKVFGGEYQKVLNIFYKIEEGEVFNFEYKNELYVYSVNGIEKKGEVG